jgi:hypothetical protein
MEIYAASRALRHADIGIASQHYLDKKKRVSTGLGKLLGKNSDLPSELKEKILPLQTHAA